MGSYKPLTYFETAKDITPERLNSLADELRRTASALSGGATRVGTVGSVDSLSGGGGAVSGLVGLKDSDGLMLSPDVSGHITISDDGVVQVEKVDADELRVSIDATLAAIAALTTAANQLLLCTGVDAFSAGPLTDAYVATANKDGLAATPSMRTLGTGATQASPGTHDHDGSDSSKLVQANTHESPDTDSATTSLHHTIGTGATQAAAGNHTHSAFANYGVFSDAKTGGVNGGSSSATTWNVRTLTTDDVVGGTGVSRAGNNVTLAAGTYWVEAVSVVSQAGLHQVRLRNTTDDTTALVGTSEFSGAVNTASRLSGYVTVSESKVFQLQHYTTSARADTGMGSPVSSGEVEVYARLVVVKIV